MEKEISEHSMQYWTEISHASVYKVLARREKKLHVDEKNTVSEGNSVKKIYTISPKGLREFKDRIREICSEVEHSIDQIDLGLSNIRHLDIKEVNELFIWHIESIDTPISGYRDPEQISPTTSICSASSISRTDGRSSLPQKKWAR